MMKFNRVLLTLLLLCASFVVNAQSGFGVKFGVTLPAENVKNKEIGNPTDYHAGMTYNQDLSLGFSFQPSLSFNASKTAAGNKSGSLRLAASLQWGPDLLLFRPFLDVSPFASYRFGNVAENERWRYGLGLGGGIEIWRFQLVCRYNWNLGGVSLGLAYFL
ncbi:MAG: hypothetical protein IKW20_07980 [Bacteroidales bacterium]|nr:hypothetical protein [Bacteroidales bacterium]